MTEEAPKEVPRILICPAMLAEQQFHRLLTLENKAQEKFLRPDERMERRRLRSELTSFFANLVKGQSDEKAQVS